MTNKSKHKTQSWKDVRARWLADPAVAAEHERTGPAMEAVFALSEARQVAGLTQRQNFLSNSRPHCRGAMRPGFGAVCALPCNKGGAGCRTSAAFRQQTFKTKPGERRNVRHPGGFCLNSQTPNRFDTRSLRLAPWMPRMAVLLHPISPLILSCERPCEPLRPGA